MNTQISSMISAIEISNYLIKDTLVNYLRYRDRSFNTFDGPTEARETSCGNGFEGFIKDVGITFEKRLVEHLSKKHNVLSVTSIITDESCRRAVALMKRGVKIIHSACLQSSVLGLRGVANLLVRSDYLNKLTNVPNIRRKKSN